MCPWKNTKEDQEEYQEVTARPATASETLPLISFPCSSIHFLWQRGGEGGCRCAIPAVWGRGRGYILDTSPVSSPKNTHTHAYRQFSRQLASCARVWTAGGSRSSGREATQTQRKHTPRRKTLRGWTRDLAVRRHDFYISSFPIWIFKTLCVPYAHKPSCICTLYSSERKQQELIMQYVV